MSAQFAPMERDASTTHSTGSGAAIWENLPSSLAAARPCEVVASAGSWGYALVGQCFSRMRRVQFDEEHQRSLLSCHSTEESERSDGYSFPDDAMLELRRRVMKDESLTRKPTFARDLEYEYPIQQYPLSVNRKPASRWEKRKANALALKLQAEQESRNNRAKAAAAADSDNTGAAQQSGAAFTALLTATERALDDILLHNIDSVAGSEPSLLADDVRRLSVDELLAPRGASLSSSTLSTCSSSSSIGGAIPPEKTCIASSSNVVTAFSSEDALQLTADARELRAWLAAMDPPRASEYYAYAPSFEAQGFAALRDLAELGAHEVEQAMSEVGVAKFAHRARIRKAIVRLCQNSSSSGGRNDASAMTIMIAETQAA